MKYALYNKAVETGCWLDILKFDPSARGLQYSWSTVLMVYSTRGLQYSWSTVLVVYSTRHIVV